MEEANRIIREGQLAQQLPMPRPIATAHATLNATASIGNHTTVLMGVNVNPQHITRTILNQQQQHTIINATGTTATLQQTLQTDTMLHHTKPDLSLPDAKKPRMLDPSASSQLQPVSTTYVDLSTPTTNLTGQAYYPTPPPQSSHPYRPPPSPHHPQSPPRQPSPPTTYPWTPTPHHPLQGQLRALPPLAHHHALRPSAAVQRHRVLPVEL